MACRRISSGMATESRAVSARRRLILCAGNQLTALPRSVSVWRPDHGLCRGQRWRTAIDMPMLGWRRNGAVTSVPALSVAQIEEQLGRSVDRVMAEGSLYDRELAALAIKQAQGDLIEAAFLLRAYRTTLPRFAHSKPVETATMRIDGGFPRSSRTCRAARCWVRPMTIRIGCWTSRCWKRCGSLPARIGDGPMRRQCRVCLISWATRDCWNMMSPEREPGDLTREPLTFPADRDVRLQALARGDEGFLLGLGYSTQRGYGGSHPFAGEIRMGEVAVEIEPAELGFAIDIGDLVLTECQMVNQFKGSKTVPPQFTRGYGLVFGFGERKAMAMALVDRAMRAEELGEDVVAPAQNVEFVLYHSDNIEATGFVEHLKLPHYVDFQSELQNVRRMREEWERNERLQFRLSGRADETDDPPGAAESRCDPRPSGAVWLTRNAAALRLGHRWHPGHRFHPGRRRRAESDRPRRRRYHQCGFHSSLLCPYRGRRHDHRDGRRNSDPDPAPHSRETTSRRPDYCLSSAATRAAVSSGIKPGRNKRMHGLADYGLMHVKLYEDIARFGQISISYDYPGDGESNGI